MHYVVFATKGKKMELNLDILLKSPLFYHIDKSDLRAMLKCLGAKPKMCKKDSYIIFPGESVEYMGIVLSGEIAVMKEDAHGNRSILAKFGPSEMFGGALAYLRNTKSAVSAIALEDSEVLLIDNKRIISTCPSACVFHTMLIKNMLGILAGEVIMLNNRLDVISKRTTREKLLTFFQEQKNLFDSNSFAIPYNREQLADYLFVDRSAMSRELSKMRDEGLIKFKKNKFELLQ